MIFKYGFEYNKVLYGWNDKRLYRLPFYRLKRSYGLKEIKPIREGKVYNIQQIQKTIAQLKTLTVEINEEVKVIINKDVPF